MQKRRLATLSVLMIFVMIISLFAGCAGNDSTTAGPSAGTTVGSTEPQPTKPDPTDPTTPNPTDPTDPADPTDPTDPTDPSKPAGALFTDDEKGTYNMVDEEMDLNMTLVIRDDNTVDFIDRTYEINATGLTVKTIECGFTFTYEDPMWGETVAKFYFENGNLYLDPTDMGTYVLMLKEGGNTVFTAEQVGLYELLVSEEEYYVLFVNEDGTVTYNTEGSTVTVKENMYIFTIGEKEYAFTISEDCKAVVLFIANADPVTLKRVEEDLPPVDDEPNEPGEDDTDDLISE